MVSQKKPSKKLLAIILAILMIASSIPASLFTTVFAAQVDEIVVEFETYDKTATVTLTQSDDNTITNTVEATNGKAVFGAFPGDIKPDDEKAYDIHITDIIGYEDIDATGQLSENGKYIIPETSLTALEQVEVTGKINNNSEDITIAYSAYGGKLTGNAVYSGDTYTFNAYKGIEYTVKYSVADKYNTVSNKTITPSDTNKEIADVDLVVKKFTIATSAGSGGNISSFDGDIISYGDTRNISVTADSGYRIDTITGLGGDPEAYKGNKTANIPLDSITKNYTVNATFYKQTYVVKFDVTPKGEVTYDTDKTALGGAVTTTSVDEFGTVEFTAKANTAEGYHVERVTGCDTELTDGDNSTATYTNSISNITSEKTVIVTFAINKYEVTVNTSGNGSATVDNAEVNHGSSATVTIQPDEGYMISSVKVNGTEAEATGEDFAQEYTLELNDVVNDKTVDITFEQIQELTVTDKIDNEKYSITFTKDGASYEPVVVGNKYIVPDGTEVKIVPKDPYIHSSINFKPGYKDQTITSSVTIDEIDLNKTNRYSKWEKIKDINIEIVFDKNAPTMGAPTKEPNKPYNNSEYTVKVSVTDDYAGVKDVYYNTTENFDTAVKANYDNLNNEASFVTTTEEYNGTYYIWAVDKVENKSASKSIYIGIDKTIPTVDTFEFSSSGLNVTDFGTYSNNDINVTITASDDDSSTTNSGIKSITFNGETIETTSGSAVFTLKKADFTTGKAVSAKATDNAGNVSIVTVPNSSNSNIKSNVVTISDTTAAISITKSSQTPQYSNGTEIWYDRDNAFTVKVTDDFGIKTVEILMNGQAVDLNGDLEGAIDKCDLGSQAVKEKTYTINTSENHLDGKNEIKVIVNNVNNNTSNNSDVVYIDTTKPDVVDFEFTSKGTTALDKVLNFLTFGIFFNEKIEIKVTATDENSSAGLKEITLYGDEVALDTQPIIGGVATFELPAEVIADETMHLNKEITAKATDNVYNITADFVYPTTTNSDTFASSGLMIETIAPVVNVNIPDAADNKNSETADENDWYADNIDFNINIVDSDSGIRKVEVDINGETITTDKDSKNIVEEFNKKDTKTTELNFRVNTDQATIKEDGSYTVTVKVTDNAGNVNDSYTKTIYKDIDNPSITDFKFEATGYDKDTATEETNQAPVQETSYGFYFMEDTKVTVTSNDVPPTSGIKSITYYAVDKDGGKSQETVKLVDKDNRISFTIPANFKGQIYAKATDNVDNTPSDYSNPNSAVVENPEQHEKTSYIKYQLEETPYTDEAGNSLYAKDTTIAIEVSDTYSGIRQIDWEIVSPYDDKKQAGTVKVDNNAVVTSEAKEGFSADCIGQWSAQTENNLVVNLKNTITVSNDSNNIQIKLTLTDRAGNVTKDIVQKLSIDKTAPKIAVQMNENDDDTYNGIFKVNRTANIYVYERNFNSEAFNYVVSKVDDNEAKTNINIKPDFKKIDEVVIDGVECFVYKMSYEFASDGDYSFETNAQDVVGNKIDDKAVKYSSDKTADYLSQNDDDRSIDNNFTIDKTVPVISVSYDNNEAQNGKFFKANRTATITVEEHNFDVNRVVITQTSALSGSAISNPSVSWVNNGNTHIATINYNNDGDYTFDITMTDKAGNKEENVNYGSSVAAKEFTVDTTYNNIVKVDGIADKGVLGLVNGDINADAKINITINDVNLDNYNVKLTRSRVVVNGESDEELDASQENVIDNPETQVESGIDVTSKFVSRASGTSNATAVISIPKRDENGVKNDGLYTLRIEAKDKAGNAYDTNRNIITFSVNRFGSVFTFSNDLYKLLNDNDGYTKSVESTDLIIYEYNATDLREETVEVIANNDSKTLVENADYTVKTENRQDAGSWSQNTYKVKPENFKNDGVYTLRVSSKDAASITSQTVDYDVCNATFRVDSTPADIISVNYSTEVEKMLIGNKASAKTDALTISFAVEDLIRIEKIEVYVNDAIEKTYTYGKDFDDANTFDGGQFVIADGGASTQNFKIVVTDKAGNVIDTSNKDEFKPGYVFFDQLVVSPNAFAQFFANKALFFGSIAVVAVAAGTVIFIVAKKRRKNDEHPEQA